MSFFRQKNLSVILSEEEIRARVRELGQQITEEYSSLGGELVLVGVLKGSFVFLADLARAIDLPVTVDFIGLSSYGDATESSGVVRLTSDLSKPIEGKHLLIVEDIVDTGLTMRYLLENLRTRSPATVKLCSLLEKPTKNQSGISVDYLGFTIPDRFVVGYGLDASGRYRNVPFVGVLEG
ncbi:MAG: hypoxanthine phosphoribosyltransferase [Myxococcota bacterium]